ncbi:MAG: hypothetical protein KF912_14480 [Phycisphaeraceae bacterium]|nr:hypothetical protein [Phycisphaeraceae bacterium]
MSARGVQRCPSTRVLHALAAFGLGVRDCERMLRAERRAWREGAARIAASGRNASVAAILGPSGSGKSSVLREVGTMVERAGCYALRSSDGAWATEMEGRATVEIPRTSLGESISLLARVGLAEPRLFGLGFEALSDGQRARLRLALLMRDALAARRESGAPVWLLIDEFGSGLDITTARGVASALARFVRRTEGVAAAVCVHDERALAWLEPEITLELSLDAQVGVRERGERVKGVA